MTWVENWRFPSARQQLWTSEMTSPISSTTSTIAPGTLFEFFDAPIFIENFIYSGVIFMTTLLLLLTNGVVIFVIFSKGSLRDVIHYYLVSLAASDMATSLIIGPLSTYAAFNSFWRFGMPNSDALCRIIAYIGIVLISGNVYIFMWIGVDRYAIIYKPGRYEAEQTFTRCKCWIVFTWITASLLCCPTLFTNMAVYNPKICLCVIDWTVMPAYSITLGVLVVVPTLLSVVYTYGFIFNEMRKIDELEQEVRVIIETDSSIMSVFVIIVVFTLSWIPWFTLIMYEMLSGRQFVETNVLHFSLAWLGLSGGCWKLIILTVMNGNFRKRLKRLCVMCCRSGMKARRKDYDTLRVQRERYL